MPPKPAETVGNQAGQPIVPRVALVTAGAANMICGSCLSDNALARSLHRRGIDVQLIPTYTPIRTDDTDTSIDRVFFGGVNVYLDQHLPLYHRLPRWIASWLDHPGLLRWVSRRGLQTDAAHLGPLCVSMLQGHRGRQQREVRQLLDYLKHRFPADWICFSNVMISGSAELLKQELSARIVVILQGDDLFLNSLDVHYRRQALAEIRRIDRSVDRYLCHSRFYADRMAALLGLDQEKIGVVPLGIDVRDLLADDSSPAAMAGPTRPPTVGYLARLAPEKGLHLACEAVLALRKHPATAKARLCVAGWRGESHRAYADEAMRRLKSRGANAVEYRGEVTRDQKRQFLADIDVLCVPSPYEEPKGLYVLEAMAAGVPVVSPRHGAFPEVIEETCGGRLFDPHNMADLTAVLGELLTDHELRRELGQRGRQSVLAARTVEHYAARVWHEFVALCDATNGDSVESADR